MVWRDPLGRTITTVYNYIDCTDDETQAWSESGGFFVCQFCAEPLPRWSAGYLRYKLQGHPGFGFLGRFFLIKNGSFEAVWRKVRETSVCLGEPVRAPQSSQQEGTNFSHEDEPGTWGVRRWGVGSSRKQGLLGIECEIQESKQLQATPTFEEGPFFGSRNFFPPKYILGCPKHLLASTKHGILHGTCLLVSTQTSNDL